MQRRNKYGFISGGCIFDWLDRAALCAINDAYPETKDQQIYTSLARIDYYKQLCNDDDDVTRVVRVVDNPHDGEYFVIIDMKYYTTVVASAEFVFKRAKHNYCETGGKDGRNKTV